MSALLHAIVGFDGSEAALHALRWTASRLPDPESLQVVRAGPPESATGAEADGYSVHHYDGPPAKALIEAAVAADADAVVVGPHGSGLGRGLGTVAKRLLRDSPVPVIVIDGQEPPRSLDPAPPVVACVGYGAPADAASHWAADFAEEQGLPLVLLHAVAYRPVFAVDSASDVLASYLGTGVSTAWAKDELDALAAELTTTHPTLEISIHVDHKSVIKAVLNAGETAELVVLGKRSDEEFLHTIGTPRLRRLIARSNFPTAVVPCRPTQR